MAAINLHFKERLAIIELSRPKANAINTDMVQELIGAGLEVECVRIYKGWMEVDTFEDYQRAWADMRR